MPFRITTVFSADTNFQTRIGVSSTFRSYFDEFSNTFNVKRAEGSLAGCLLEGRRAGTCPYHLWRIHRSFASGHLYQTRRTRLVVQWIWLEGLLAEFDHRTDFVFDATAKARHRLFCCFHHVRSAEFEFFAVETNGIMTSGMTITFSFAK